MKEKIFLFLVLILIVVVFANLVNWPKLSFGQFEDLATTQKYPPYIKGVYLTSWTASDSEKIDYFINLARNTELNAVIIDIKEVDGLIAIDNIIPNLQEVIEKFHQENVYTIARIVVFKDGLLPKTRPELALKNQQGRLWRDWAGYTWLDPASQDVWDYHIDIAKQAIKLGFDEINFDYIRFPSDGNISTIIYPIWDEILSKPEVIREFFKYVDQQLKPFNVFLSADLFGLTMIREDDMNIGQILEYALPYFDFICPMVYPSHYPPTFEGYLNPADHPYEIIKMNLENGKQRAVGARAKLRPWLQDFSLGAIYNKKMIELQKQAVYDTDSYGWLLWNPASRYTEEALERD